MIAFTLLYNIVIVSYGSVYVHRVDALVGIISTLRLSICLVDLPNLDKLMSRCRVKMT